MTFYNDPQYGQNSSRYDQQPYVDATASVVREKAQRSSVTRAYGEMALGLLLTAVIAAYAQASGAFYSFLAATGTIGWIVLLVVQIAVVWFLSARIMNMSVAAARSCFYVYAALTGFTMASIFTVYSLGSIAVVFALTAGFFFVLTMIGITTKVDLLKFGPIFTVALIVLIIAEILISVFSLGGTSVMVVSAISILLFAGLTAYDAQFTRAMFDQYGNDVEMTKRISILCALHLYLDFINFFLSLLNLVGDSN